MNNEEVSLSNDRPGSQPLDPTQWSTATNSHGRALLSLSVVESACSAAQTRSRPRMIDTSSYTSRPPCSYVLCCAGSTCTYAAGANIPSSLRVCGSKYRSPSRSNICCQPPQCVQPLLCTFTSLYPVHDIVPVSHRSEAKQAACVEIFVLSLLHHTAGRFGLWGQAVDSRSAHDLKSRTSNGVSRPLWTCLCSDPDFNMAILRMKSVLSILLLSHKVLALQVSPNSPCASVCLDDATADPSDPNTSNTYPTDIVCSNVDYDSTPVGRKFEACTDCLRNSTSSSSGENDQSWFLCESLTFGKDHFRPDLMNI